MAVVAIVGTGVGTGVAVASNGGSSSVMAAHSAPPGPTTTVAGTPNAAPVAARPGKPGVDPARQAWAHKYGLDRATMANLPDVAAATPQQR
ncbi:MAG: hypothetical protein M3N98_02095, partial [Actinomycetota bacterium]|nr:hypothetical protein [Actinomycetota bacterium]